MAPGRRMDHRENEARRGPSENEHVTGYTQTPFSLKLLDVGVLHGG